MPCAHLRIDIPEDVWIGDLSVSHPNTRFRILSALGGGDDGMGLMELDGPALQAVVDEMRAYDAVQECAVLEVREDRVVLQFQTDLPLLLSPVENSGAPLKLPFDIRDGEAHWEVTASRDRLSALGSQLDELGIHFHVDRVQQRVEVNQLLTDCQQDIVATAVELGYYDTPRDCSLTEVADALDIAKSTASETLHRAESKIITSFVDERDAERARPPTH